VPERTHPSSISIDFDADSPADQVEKIFICAVLDAKHVLRDPPSDATVKAIRRRTASYCVSFYVADFADIPSA
jgi:small-conductance mechanosensitive channel